MKLETIFYWAVAAITIPAAVALINIATKETRFEKTIAAAEKAIARNKAQTNRVLAVRSEFEKDERLVAEKKQEAKLSLFIDQMSSETYAAYRKIPTVENARLLGVREQYSSSCGIDVHDTTICVTDTGRNRNVCFHFATGETRCVEDNRSLYRR